MKHLPSLLRPIVFALILVAPSSAAAQYHPLDIDPGPRRLDVSGSGGFVLSSDWSDLVLLGSVSGATGVLEQVLARDLMVEPGPVFDAVVTYWEGRYGFRVHGGYARSCLSTGRSCGPALTTGGESVDVRTYIYDVGGVVGLIEDASAVASRAFRGAGDVVVLLGEEVVDIGARERGQGERVVAGRAGGRGAASGCTTSPSDRSPSGSGRPAMKCWCACAMTTVTWCRRGSSFPPPSATT